MYNMGCMGYHGYSFLNKKSFNFMDLMVLKFVSSFYCYCLSDFSFNSPR